MNPETVSAAQVATEALKLIVAVISLVVLITPIVDRRLRRAKRKAKAHTATSTREEDIEGWTTGFGVLFIVVGSVFLFMKAFGLATGLFGGAVFLFVISYLITDEPGFCKWMILAIVFYGAATFCCLALWKGAKLLESEMAFRAKTEHQMQILLHREKWQNGGPPAPISAPVPFVVPVPKEAN